MIRAAVVGVGYLGRFHAQKYKGLADTGQGVQLVGVYDANLERCLAIATELNVSGFKSLDEVAQNAQAVTIATNTQTHYEVARFFLQKGIHVNVEKPMTTTVEQARELLGIAEQMKVQLTVGHSERFNPVYQYLIGKFRQPEFLELRRHAPFRLRGSDVSVVLDLMVHDLDMVVNWCQTPVELVSAVGGKIHSSSLDWAECNLRAGKQTVHISVSRVAGAMIRSIRGFEGRQSFLADFQANECEWMTWKSSQENPEQKEVVKIEKKDHLLLETQSFLAAVARKALPVVPGIHGLRVLELALAIEDQCLKRGNV